MTLRTACLAGLGLLLAGACATPVASPSASAAWGEAVVPLAERAAPVRAPHHRRTPPDAWSLFAPEPLAATPALAAAVPQGVGAAYKPQRSLASTHLLLGQQQLDEDYWRPSSLHLAFGLETSFERYGDWFGGEGGIAYVQDDDEGTFDLSGLGVSDVSVNLKTIEVWGGFHRTFLRESFLRPYVGVGGTLFWVQADQDIHPVFGTDISDGENDWVLGAYAHGGLSLQISRNFQLGVDARVVGLTRTGLLYGPHGDLDYQQVSIFLGYGG